MRRENLDFQARVDALRPVNASKHLDFFGKLLMDNREMTIWEHDTRLLPAGARIWRRRAKDFARRYIRPDAARADSRPREYDPRPIISQAARKGFQTLLLALPLGTAFPGSYFLKSASFQVAVVAEEFAVESGGIALLLMAHHLGCAPLILSGHTPTILRHLLPLYARTLKGKPEIMAFAITEPGAGSDVEETEGGAKARLVTTARQVDGGFVINGRKCFISNGALADKVTLFAKLEGEGLESWTCFLIEKGMEGYSIGRQEHKLGQRASDASELILDDVRVPNRNVVGRLRSGWANNRNVLNYSRPVVGAMALGHARGAFESALKFCRNTMLGGKRLIDYQDIQIELADMIVKLWSARALIWHSCSQFRCYQSASAAAKVAASDISFEVCTKALEIMGDHGYLESSGAERLWRDSRLTQIYEGTNQINRLAVIEHQWAEITAGSDGRD
ncbi:MAG TPA: acyl-CoA dehydrogenase family protein [Deltaproteobacteria bacterium]|nr:acyl-CoA dehydrogenase family protein [Deltaproteobacteria bacterium]